MGQFVSWEPGSEQIYVTRCYRCKTPVALTHSLFKVAHDERAGELSWFCPNGHSQVFTKGQTTEEKLRHERDRLAQRNAQLADEAREAAERAEKAERSLKRHKKRAAAGTCPCCKRTFSALATHMKTQHPEFVVESGAKVVPLRRKTS